MTMINLKYINSFRSPDGQLRHYFRRGQLRVKLPGEPGSMEFMTAYHAALAQAPLSEKPPSERAKKIAKLLAPRAAITQAKKINGQGAIYFVQGMKSDHIKIGFSTDVLSRIKGLTTGSPESLQLLGAISGTRADEQALHRKFKHLRIKGEWFNNAPDLIDYIQSVHADPANAILRNEWDE